MQKNNEITSFIFIKTVLFMLLSLFHLGANTSDINPPQSKGIIILLNGPSASGKSSIQKEIQKQYPQLVLTAGIDTFFDALLPEPNLQEFHEKKELVQYAPNGELIRKISLQKDHEGNPIIPLEIGPAGEKVISGMHKAIRGYAEAGNIIVVDYILYKDSWRKDLISAFSGSRVYLIGIQAPLSVIEERERKRNTSPQGHARSHYSTVHEGMLYDLTLDVSKLSPQESARLIIEFIQKNSHPSQLEKMRQLMKIAE